MDGGATVAFVSEVEKCPHFFPLHCLKLAKDIFNYRLTVRYKGDESMCNLVLTSEAYHAVESSRRLSSFARLFNVRVFKFRAA